MKHAGATSLGRLLLEKTLRGQDRWRCLEIQLLMLSQSTVPLGGGPSSRCSSTSCFWARTALPSSIRSSCRKRSVRINAGPKARLAHELAPVLLQTLRLLPRPALELLAELHQAQPRRPTKTIKHARLNYLHPSFGASCTQGTPA